MTNPTLERAARACARAFYEGEALDEPIFFETYGGRSVDELVEEFWPEFVPETRAVLMAVLPELSRHGDEGYVYYDDLNAILAEGE